MPPRNQIRVRPKRLLMQATLALALLVIFSMPKVAVAQHHGGGAGGGGFPGGGMSGGGGMHDGMGRDFPRGGNVPEMSRNGNVRMHAGLQVGPPGRWWDDKHFAKQLKLSDDQQRRMDAIFEQSRPVLLNRLESLEKEEQRMEVLTHAKTLDEAALFTQIDRIEQARADLSKANLHYLVQLRSELDQDQISSLEDQH
ncbi:MAG TPA: periplasmic heavy metal sensor [Acidobacteriaceae bacterium]|nr:periplasmic heavy metal sensor [Acidobacteriaceae bacterium]